MALCGVRGRLSLIAAAPRQVSDSRRHLGTRRQRDMPVVCDRSITHISGDLHVVHDTTLPGSSVPMGCPGSDGHDVRRVSSARSLRLGLYHRELETLPVTGILCTVPVLAQGVMRPQFPGAWDIHDETP